MLAIREISEWEYVTSQSVGIGAGAGWAVGAEAGSSVTLKHKDEGTHKFWYASLGIGAGAGVETTFKLPAVPSVALESFTSYGVLCILETFKGKELKPSDITGYTLYLGVSTVVGIAGVSAYAMLLGIENINDLIKEAYSDVYLQLGQALGGGSQLVLDLQDKLGMFYSNAKAVLFMVGQTAGFGVGVTALGSVGYVWQGTPDKIGEVIIDLKSVEELPIGVHLTQKDTTVITLSGDLLFDWDEYVLRAAKNGNPSAASELEKYCPRLNLIQKIKSRS